jgi:predicted anti-sigma-YlaC factor YlaD
MLSCRDVARRADALLDAELGTLERVQVRLHLMMCRGCAAFVEQMRATHRLTAQALDAQSAPPGQPEILGRILELARHPDNEDAAGTDVSTERDPDAKPKD